MTVFDAIDKNLIKVPLASQDRVSLVHELVSLYSERVGLSEREAEVIESSVLDREALSPTVLDNGIAIPHAKCDFIKKSAVVIGLSPDGIDFGGDDRTTLFFLVLSPSDQPGDHIRVLSTLAKVCTSSLFVKALNSARSKEEIYNLLYS